MAKSDTDCFGVNCTVAGNNVVLVPHCKLFAVGKRFESVVFCATRSTVQKQEKEEGVRETKPKISHTHTQITEIDRATL